ncbi:hypothetical protein Tco_1572735 [Tanacetum coccineum]
MYHQKNVDYVEILCEGFTYQIDNKVYKKQEKMYYPRFTKVIINHFLIQENSLSWRNRIGMHTSKDDYLINTLRFVSRRETSQIYGAVLPECEVPPKVARKFKKASPSKKEIALFEKAQMKEARMKSLRDFHKTHPSGFGTVAKKPLSVEKITPTITSERTGDKPGVPDVNNDDSSESESVSWGK